MGLENNNVLELSLNLVFVKTINKTIMTMMIIIKALLTSLTSHIVRRTVNATIEQTETK